MADSVHTQVLGVYENLPFSSPCVPGDGPATATFWHVTTWGPVITIVAVAISAGAPAPGCEVFLCPGASSAVYVRGVPEATGVFTFTIDATKSDASHLFITCEQTVTLEGPPAGPGGGGCSLITIAPASPLSDAFRTEPVAVTFTAADGTAPYTWDLSEASDPLPDGLTLSSGGLLAGAPTTVGAYAFTVRALDADGCRGIAAVALEVLEPDPIVVFPEPPLPGGDRGEDYAPPDGVLFTAEGGIGEPYAFTISDGALPPGLALATTGVLEGLPTQAGAFTFTVRATDIGSPAPNFGEREYMIVVAGLRIVIDGTDVTGPGHVSRAHLELGLNRQATGHLEIGDGYIPARGADVLIYARDGVTPIFGGIVLARRIQGMTEHHPANRGNIELVDYSAFFDDADPVTLTYDEEVDLADLIADIVAASLAVYGITYAATPFGIGIPPFTWVDVTVTDAFKRITDSTGLVFRVLPSKALDVFAPAVDPAPVEITDATINAFDLHWADPPTLPRNTVDLLCGPTGNGVATQRWTADGVATSWEVDIPAVLGTAQAARAAHGFLGYAPATNFAAGETVTLGSSTYTFRASLVGDVAGEVVIGADGEASLVNLIAAITDAGGSGYAPSTPVNADATAYLRNPDQLAATALVVGEAGNAIAVADTAANAFWYGEGDIPIAALQLGSDASGASGWTQGYILEDPDGDAVARPIGAPGDGAAYAWDVTDGRGTITLDAGTPPPTGTVLELKYLAVFPFHARYSTGTPPITFRENHPEITSYAEGVALAQSLHARESALRRQLDVFTDVDGFLPGQALVVDTTHRGGLDATFLVGTVQITLVNAHLWEYQITAEESAQYSGSYVEEWKGLIAGGSSPTAPAAVDGGGATVAGDIYSDGRQPFRAAQSLGGHKLTNVEDPTDDQDAATKAYVDGGGGGSGDIRSDGSVDFAADQSMGGFKLTDVDDPAAAQDAATKAYVEAGHGAGIVLLEIRSATAGATIDFTTRNAPEQSGATLQDDFEEYLIVAAGLFPSTNAADLLMRIGTGAGPTWDAGTNYQWASLGLNTAGGGVNDSGAGATAARVLKAMSNTATWAGQFSITWFSLRSTALLHSFTGTGFFFNSTPAAIQSSVGGQWTTSGTAATAIRFLPSVGNITGTIKIYGIRK